MFEALTPNPQYNTLVLAGRGYGKSLWLQPPRLPILVYVVMEPPSPSFPPSLSPSPLLTCNFIPSNHS